MKRRFIILYVCILLFIGVSCNFQMPEISEDSLIGSTKIMEGYTEIEDPEVFMEKDKITFYFIPTEEVEVSKDRLREIGSDYMKFLGGYTASDELLGPSDESYGEIYDYYDVEIIIEGNRGAVLDRGSKSKGEPEILWVE